MILCSRWPKRVLRGYWNVSHRKLLRLNHEGATLRLDSNQSISLLAKHSLKHRLLKSNSLQRMLIRAGKKKKQGEDKRQRPLKLSPQFTNKAGSQHFAKQIIRLSTHNTLPHPLPHLSSEPKRSPEVPPGPESGSPCHTRKSVSWSDVAIAGAKGNFSV